MAMALVNHHSVSQYAENIHLKICTVGGANVTPALIAQFRSKFKVKFLTIGFGMTGEQQSRSRQCAHTDL